MRAIRLLPFVALGLSVTFTTAAENGNPDGATKVDLVFQGGHETDPRDHGRPVALIAAALGVPAPVFREAFRHVHPAGLGQPPQDAQVRQNKQALVERLAAYGVTNDRLDEVSDYYRYRAWTGELWRHVDATGYALVKSGKIVSVTLTNPGAGYTVPPKVSAPGIALTVYPLATLTFGTNLATNGSVSKIVAAPIGDADREKPQLVPNLIDLPQAPPTPPNIQKPAPPPTQ